MRISTALTGLVSGLLAALATPALALPALALPALALPVLALTAPASPVPAVPALAAYGKLPALDLVSLSPSGEKIAFVATDGETRRLFVRNVGGEAIAVDTLGASKVRGVTWVGDDFVLVAATATLKYGTGALDKWSYTTRAELQIVVIVDLKTHTMKKMFAGKELEVWLGVVDAIYGARQIDGRWVEFVHAFTTQNQTGNIYKVDLQTGGYDIVTRNTGDDFDYLIGLDGRVKARARYEESSKSWIVYSGNSGIQVVLKRRSPLFTVGLSGLGRADGTMLVTDTTDLWDTYEEYDARTAAAPVPLFEGLDIASEIRDPATGLLLGGVRARGRGAVLFDPKLQRRYDAAVHAFPGLRVKVVSFSTGFARMVVMTDGGDDSGAYWLIDMATGKADELTAAYPAIVAANVAPTRMFDYKAADGLALQGLLTLPRGSAGKALPLVVMPHGGPIGFDDQIGFDWWAQAFASRGYAVFQPNYRGSSGYGVPFRAAGMGEWGHKMLSDMTDGVAALAREGTVDAARVCIVGASYGGYAALAGVTLQSGVYRCAVSVAGPSEVSALMGGWGDKDNSAVGRYNQLLFGVDFAGSPRLQAISPLRHVDRVSAPILMIHGKDDTVVPYVQSLSMHESLDKAGKPNQLVSLTAEDHWLSRESTRVQTLEASVSWVEKYNPAR